MMYLFVDRNQIKLLYLKKTLLSQFESATYEKKHQVDLLNDGKITNTDLLASAVKEAITFISSTPVKEKEVCLILPQKAFYFMRSEVPKDLAPTAIESFIRDKARAEISADLDTTLNDYIITDNEKEKQVLFFAIDKELLQKYLEVFNLINLQVTSVIPETLAYFKLFEKTLRKDKKEFILYVTMDKTQMNGYLYDTFGPLDKARSLEEPLKETSSIEKILKTKATEYEKQGKKLNRLILAGENSETIRQDTFTKNVGVWTNPLKRIIPDFYQDYLKLLVTDPNKPIPFLQFDVCVGAFIFSLENKSFSLIKKGFGKMPRPQFTAPAINLPMKEILIFVVSFILSFILWMGLSRMNLFNKSGGTAMTAANTTPTVVPSPLPPSPTLSPTPAIDRKDLRIKVLNGSGTAGKASDVKTVLAGKGYAEVLTGNADSFDFDITEVQVKDVSSSSATLVKDDLKANAPDAKITALSEDETTADVVIIVGKDFK